MKLLKILILISLFILNCKLIKGQEAVSNKEKTAQSNYYVFDYIETLTPEYYTALLDSIKNNQSEDFFTLRMAYTKTKGFSPYDHSAGDSLKIANKLIDSKKYTDAILVVENILKNNFVDITTHLYAAYLYEQIGDSLKMQYHIKVYTGLLKSIDESGDGNSPGTAYIVINTKEEYDFLKWYELKFVQQSLEHSEKYSFDLMKVTEKEAKKEHKIYFNVTLSFRSLIDEFKK